MSEDIRRRLEMVEQDGRQSPEDEIHMLNVWHHYASDVRALLAVAERVEELERENERLRKDLDFFIKAAQHNLSQPAIHPTSE